MAGDPILASPAIANNGTIYSGCDGDIMYAINPDGTEKWTFTTAGSNIRSTPAIAADGSVYIASDDNNLYALNAADGTVNWMYAVGGDVEGAIAIDADGTIFLGVDEGTPNGSVFAINPNGTLKWQSVNTGRVLSSPAIANGFVYFGTKDTNKLYALNATTGVEAWSYTAGDIILSSPAIGDDGKIYFGSFDNKLYCLNSDGTLNFGIVLSKGDNLWSSPAIKAGKLFIGSYNGRLFSVDIPSVDLANSNWPMFGRNLQHTSSADATLSITDFNSNFGQSLKVFYKNGEINIKLENFNGLGKVTLFDMLGRNIKSKTLEFGSNNYEKLPIESIKSGIYIINLQTENNSFTGSRKFIKSN
jgi:outer membrane protein assembly factor BamB